MRSDYTTATGCGPTLFDTRCHGSYNGTSTGRAIFDKKLSMECPEFSFISCVRSIVALRAIVLGITARRALVAQPESTGDRERAHEALSRASWALCFAFIVVGTLLGVGLGC